MGVQEGINVIGIVVKDGVVGLPGVLNFTDILRVAEDCFTVDDAGDLGKGQTVVFDGKGGLDGADSVAAPQLQVAFVLGLQAARRVRDVEHLLQDVVVEGERRFHVSLFSAIATDRSRP